MLSNSRFYHWFSVAGSPRPYFSPETLHPDTFIYISQGTSRNKDVNYWHHHILNKAADNFANGSTDNDPGEVKNITFDQKVLKVSPESSCGRFIKSHGHNLYSQLI
jgi:hypothetical protein